LNIPVMFGIITNSHRNGRLAENRTNRPAPNYGSSLLGAGHVQKPLFGKIGKQGKLVKI